MDLGETRRGRVHPSLSKVADLSRTDADLLEAEPLATAESIVCGLVHYPRGVLKRVPEEMRPGRGVGGGRPPRRQSD